MCRHCITAVYASEFPLAGKTLWTIINRTDWSVSESIMRVPHQTGQRYFDIWNGKELTALIRDGYAELSMPLEPHGYGAVLRLDRDTPVAGLDRIMKRLAQQAAKPLRRLFERMGAAAAEDDADRSDRACPQCAGRHGQDTRRHVRLPGTRH